MHRNHGIPTESEQSGWLPILAALWDELAGIHNCEVFERAFRSELEHLRRFRNDYPKVSLKVLIGILEATVINAFRERFPREAIQMLRVRLNRSN